MDRRKFLLGAAAASATGAIGTSAFSSVQADRQISVNVTGDATAYLRMVPADHTSLNQQHPNGAYARLQGGELTLDFTEENEDVNASGLNARAVSVFNNVFIIENQGTQEVDLVIIPGDQSGGTLIFPQNNILFGILPEGRRVDKGISLSPGETQAYGVLATVSDDFNDPPVDDEITFFAEVNN